MKRNIQSIPLDLLKLDQENVRFGGDVAQNQREAIELMMADYEEAKKISKLAKHIAQNGLDPTELQLVTFDDDNCYIVLEGNRRLTALKLLQKPDLCPINSLVKDFLSSSNLSRDRLPREIECSIVPTREAGDMWIELKHTGQNDGAGRVNWDSDIRDERRSRQTGVESIGRQIRNIIKNNPNIFALETIKNVSTIPVTTLTRLFSSRPAQDAFQVKIINKELQPEYPLQFIAPSIVFAINLFVEQGYNVNDIRNDDDRRRFINHIPEELRPEKLFLESEENRNNNLEISGKTSVDKEESQSSQPTSTKKNESNAKPPRAQPSSKARKYLFPWALNISNSRINDIYRELRTGLEVDRYPNATAITFRVFIEVSCDEFNTRKQKDGINITRTDNSKPISDNDKLSIKVQAVTAYLEENGELTKQEAKAICRRAGQKEILGSIDHFNQFVHSSVSKPIPSELKDITEEYKPLLCAIWQ